MIFIIGLAFGTSQRRNGDSHLYMREHCTDIHGSATVTRVTQEPEQSCRSKVDSILREYENQAAAGNFDEQHSSHTETPPNSLGDLQDSPSASTTTGKKRRRLNPPDGCGNGSGTRGTVEETATTCHNNLQDSLSASTSKGKKRRRLNPPDSCGNSSGTSGTIEEAATTCYNKPGEPVLEKVIEQLVKQIRKGLRPEKANSVGQPSKELDGTREPYVEKKLDDLQASDVRNGQPGEQSSPLTASVAVEKFLWRQSCRIESSAHERAWKSRLLASCMYLFRVAITTNDRTWEDPAIDGVTPRTLRRWRDATWMINTIVGKLSSTWGLKAYSVYESFASMKKGSCTASV